MIFEKKERKSINLFHGFSGSDSGLTARGPCAKCVFVSSGSIEVCVLLAVKVFEKICISLHATAMEEQKLCE